MIFRIVAGDSVEYPRVGSRRMALRVADELASERPRTVIQVQVKRRLSLFSVDGRPKWETIAARNVGGVRGGAL